MTKKIINLKVIFVALFFVLFVVGCSSEEIEKRKVQDIVYETSNQITIELGDEIEFGEIKVKVIYSDQTEEELTLDLQKLINIYDVININNSLGEKEVKFKFLDNDWNQCEGTIIIKVIEKEYKTALKAEINNYKNDLNYSSSNIKKIKEIKLSTISSINSAINEEEAEEFVNFSKQLIDEIKTVEEEEKEITILDLLNRIDELEAELSLLINYDDTEVKTEIETIKNSLNEMTYEEDIEQALITISALSSNFYGVKATVENNKEKITSLLDILNSLVVDGTTKDEMNKVLKELTDEYTIAIDEVSMMLLNRLNEVEIIVEDGILKWRTDKFSPYTELSGLKSTSITSAGLDDAGHLIINLADGSSIDAGVVFDISADNKFTTLTEYVNSISTSLEEILEDIERIDFIANDTAEIVTNMVDYFTEMGFNFADGSSLDLMTAIITLLPEQLQSMGYDFKLEDIGSYKKQLEDTKANMDMLLNIVGELKGTANSIYDIITGEGTVLEKEALMYQELEKVSSVLVAMGIDKEKADAIESFLADARLENQKELVKKINDYFDALYNNESYILSEDILGEYYVECVKYAELTNYNSILDVNLLKENLSSIIDKDNLIIDSIVFKEIVELEKELQKLDTNLEVIKGFFATKLENEGASLGIDVQKINSYKNRILTTKSITKVIELYETILQ